MGNLATFGFGFSAALLPYLVDYVQATSYNETNECVVSKGRCLKCRDNYCTRCAFVLHRGNCVDTCPTGYKANFSTREEYMGRICQEENNFIFGLTGNHIVLVCVICGATICVLIIFCGAIIIYRRKKKATKLIRQYEDNTERREFLKHLATLRGEGETFLAMLNDTRRQVRELYYSGSDGDGAVGIQAYRPVLRDLARILLLINKKDDEIYMAPNDWQRLLAWAERLLRRYKKHNSPEVAQLVSFLQQPTAVNQLAPGSPQQIAISQSSSQMYELKTTPTNLTTFQANAPLSTFQASDKSSISPSSSSLGYTKDSPISSSLGQNSLIVYNDKLSPSGSTVGQTTPLVYNSPNKRPSPRPLQELNISSFNCNNNNNINNNNNNNNVNVNNINNLTDNSIVCNESQLNPQWEFPGNGTIEATNYTILSEWASNRDYLIDDFTILGFRPQDEITTEL